MRLAPSSEMSARWGNELELVVNSQPQDGGHFLHRKNLSKDPIRPRPKGYDFELSLRIPVADLKLL
jgi:hypothetical protein